MARNELHSSTIPIEQMPPITNTAEYEGDIVLVEKIGNAAYLDELAFNAESVTIRIEPSTDKNAAGAFPVWVNGKPAECFVNGAWREFGWLPVGQVIVVRRSVLEVIIRAKVDSIETKIMGSDSERPNNIINRFTSPVHSFSVIEDRNPRGAAWMTEMRRRGL